jgi:N-acetylneuraminic acid mutarotase
MILNPQRYTGDISASIHFMSKHFSMRTQLLLFIFSLAVLAACSKSSGKSSAVSADSAKYVSVSYAGSSLISPPSALIFSIAASWGSKMVIAGGEDYTNYTFNDSAYVYDTVTRKWSNFKLSAPHAYGAAVACNGKIFLAGGYDSNDRSYSVTAAVDIYDVSTGQWTTAQLSNGRAFIAAAAAGNTVIFAGGSLSSAVDIYDMSANQWSAGSLSVPRTGVAGAAAGNKIVFAGGFAGNTLSDVVDIYDVTTKLWSTANLSAPRSSAGAAAAGNKILFVGGGGNDVLSTVVDIYDVNTGQWTTSTQNGMGHRYSSALSSGNMILFAGGQIAIEAGSDETVPYLNIDVYNVTTGDWGYTALHTQNPDVVGAAIGNQVLLTYLTGNPYPTDSVEIYQLQ